MQPTHFTIIPDFDAQSANGGLCYISKLPKQKKDTPQKQAHEVDEFILRGPEISFEGYFDIRPAVIIETAREVFDMYMPEEVAELQAERNALDNEVLRLEQELDEANDRLSQQILLNAEQIVALEAAQNELEAAYTELYEDEDA